MNVPNKILLVRATHEYVPVNNDELHIHAGDIITITNPEEGGWWEGTLGSKTGWFPSNYVVLVEESASLQNNVLLSTTPLTTSSSPAEEQPSSLSSQQADEYKNTIVHELIESEDRFVDEMDEFLNGMMMNMINAKVGGSSDHHQSQSSSSSTNLLQSLTSSYSAIVSCHKAHILGPLKTHVLSTALPNLRVGKIMLSAAPHVQTAHTNYCKLHPKFVSFIEKHQDALSGAQQPDGVLRIITCLSAPFRRIRAYGGLLNELECHVEVFHGDRGDLQRSVGFYRELEKSLNNLRKQKEMELEVLVPGAIRDYEGSEISSLGEIMLMNLLYVGIEKLPRYFVLFPNTIVILAYDSVDNRFSYHGRICVSGITVASLNDGVEYQGIVSVANGIEISGPTIHPMIAQCPSPAIKSTWISTLTDLIRTTRCYSSSSNQVVVYSTPYLSLVNHFKRLHESGLLYHFISSGNNDGNAMMKRAKCLSKLNTSSTTADSSTRRPVLVRQDAFDYGDEHDEQYNNNEVDENESVDSGCCGGSYCSASYSSNVFIEVEGGGGALAVEEQERGQIYRAGLYAHWGLKFEYY